MCGYIMNGLEEFLMESKTDFKQRVLYKKRKVSIDIFETSGDGDVLSAVIGNIRPDLREDNKYYLYNGFYFDTVEVKSIGIDIDKGEYNVKCTSYIKQFKVYNNGKLIYNYDNNIKDSKGIRNGVLNSNVLKSINLPSYFAEIIILTNKYAPRCVGSEAKKFLDVLSKAKGI